MLTASTNIMQEEWVQRWLDKLTPKQQALVIEVLENANKPRQFTKAAVSQANAVMANSHYTTEISVFKATGSSPPYQRRLV
jgi:ATP/ADP translocase